MMTMDEARAAIPSPWTKERIVDGMSRSRRFVEHAILALYHAQTPAQQDGEDTDAKRDRKGFNRLDKPFLNDMAEHILQSAAPEGHRLTDAQLHHSLVKLRKYAKQLAELANQRAAEALLNEVRRKEVEKVINPCTRCYNAGIVVTRFLGLEVEEPCPDCGNTPYRMA